MRGRGSSQLKVVSYIHHSGEKCLIQCCEYYMIKSVSGMFVQCP